MNGIQDLGCVDVADSARRGVAGENVELEPLLIRSRDCLYAPRVQVVVEQSEVINSGRDVTARLVRKRDEEQLVVVVRVDDPAEMDVPTIRVSRRGRDDEDGQSELTCSLRRGDLGGVAPSGTRKHHEFTSADVERLIRVGYERDTRPNARRDYGLAIEMKLRLGPRLGELLGLQYRDILADGPVVTIERQWTKDGRVAEVKTKAGVRRVPLTPALFKKIAERKLKLGAGDEDFVFASERGGRPPLHSNFRRRGWNPACEEAGLVGEDEIRITPHDARHAFASQMAEDLNSSDVAQALGHTTARITEQIYVHSFNREQRETRMREAMARAAAGDS